MASSRTVRPTPSWTQGWPRAILTRGGGGAAVRKRSDGLVVRAGLTDAYKQVLMGIAAEQLASDQGFTRTMQVRGIGPGVAPNAGASDGAALGPDRRSRDGVHVREHRRRSSQDDFALESYRRAQAAQKSGAFHFEIVPVDVPGGKNKPTVVVDHDEEVAKVGHQPGRAGSEGLSGSPGASGPRAPVCVCATAHSRGEASRAPAGVQGGWHRDGGQCAQQR